MSKKVNKKWRVSGYTGVLENDNEKPIDMGFFFDEADAIAHAKRKADWHATKGRRKIKTNDYRFDYWI